MSTPTKFEGTDLPWAHAILRNQETCASPICSEVATMEVNLHGVTETEGEGIKEFNIPMGFCGIHGQGAS